MKRFHLDFIERYKTIIPKNPNSAEKISNPMARFIIKTIIETPQKAKNGHFFHINKNITKIKLTNASNP